MAIDPSILLREPTLVKMPSLSNALAENLQLKSGRMQLEQAQREAEREAALSAFLENPDLDLNDPQQRLGLAKFGKKGLEYGKAFDDSKKAHLDRVKVVRDMMKEGAAFGSQHPHLYREILTRFGQDTGEDMTDEIAEVESLPDDTARSRWFLTQGLEADKLLPETSTEDIGGSTVALSTDPLTGQVTQTGAIRNTMRPGEAQRIALETQRVDQGERRLDRLENQPAPSMTEIVDPENPKRMLRIDARMYRGGTLGAPGVIGVSGKEPISAGKELQTEEGRKSVDDQVANLRDLYTQLQEGGGITDTTKSGTENIAAGTASSGLGQAAGRLFGTKNQSLRNQITQARPLLLQAIKNATGMSAKQMDSNVELKMYLAAATDPTLDVQANIEALNNLLNLYGTGASVSGGASGSFDTPTRAQGGASVSNW